MNKKENQCFLCNSKKCFEAVVCVEHRFCEISCKNHVHKLHEYSDKVLGKNNGVMKHLMHIPQTLEFGALDEKYDFPISGWDLDKDVVRIFIDSILFAEGENLKVNKFIKIEEKCYSTSRFFDGETAKDEGFPCYVNFHTKESYKKGYGKCTMFTVSLERYEDD